MATDLWHAFRRVRTGTGYSRVEAEVYMPSAGEARVPVSMYGYVGVEKADGSGGGEFGLVIAPKDSGGRHVVMAYRSIWGANPRWDYVRDQSGVKLEFPAGRYYRLVAEAGDGVYRAWVYDRKGNELVYRKWATAVTADGTGQHVRRVASLFTLPGERAYGVVRWVNVAVGRPGDMHPLSPDDLGDVTEATEPPGRKWVYARTVNPYSEEEVGFDIVAETDVGTAAAVVSVPLLAVVIGGSVYRGY